MVRMAGCFPVSWCGLLKLDPRHYPHHGTAEVIFSNERLAFLVFKVKVVVYEAQTEIVVTMVISFMNGSGSMYGAVVSLIKFAV